MSHRPIDRRAFLKTSAGACAAATLTRCQSRRPFGITRPRAEQVVLVRFGGGVRHQDLFDTTKPTLAPYLCTLAQAGTFVPDVWNDHLTRHDTATLYLLTGRYGARLDSNERGSQNLADIAASPTIFEAYRRHHGAPRSRALAAGVPSTSTSVDFGPTFGATALAGAEAGPARPLPYGDPTLGPASHVELANQHLGRLLLTLKEPRLPRDPGARWRAVRGQVSEVVAGHALASPELTEPYCDALADRVVEGRPYIRAETSDEWLLDVTLRAMRLNRPVLTAIAFSTPDIAHRGAFGSYATAVRRIDVLLERLARFLAEDPYYRGRTLLLVTTDCGRGDPRFDRHDEPFDDPSLRRLFLVAAGPCARRGLLGAGRRQQIDLAPSIAQILEFPLEGAEGEPIPEILA